MKERNLEEIRRKNLEDNQLFLKRLRINNIRDDFVESARSIASKAEPKKKVYTQYEKVERITRYSLKVKSGEIIPSIPKWERKTEVKSTSFHAEWTAMYKNNANPYQRTFKPRVRK